MSWERIRPLVLGVPRRGDEILVSEGYDPGDDERFYRPIGGGIEFGEYSPDALRREFREELGVEIGVEACLGTLENVFSFDGQEGHEVVIAYEVTLPEALYERSELEGHEDGMGTYTAVWRSIPALEASDLPVYPEGLLGLLTGGAGHVVPPDGRHTRTGE